MCRASGARPESLTNPTQSIELLKNSVNVLPFQAAHGAIAALNVAVGDTLELMRQDVAGN
jgi:hypothetical protein